MFVIRPIKEKDIDDLERFAYGTSMGMLSLPKDRSLLKGKIAHSMESFSRKVSSPIDELYLFVLEDIKTGKVGGSCGIYAKTGIDRPLCYFRIETLTNKKSKYPVPGEVKILHPTIEKNGPSELCSLFLDKELRKMHLGELLSRSRYLFISENLNRFDNITVARLRGFINIAKMTSPFWEGLGRHFLDMKFVDTQILLQKGVDFASEFLPRYPIYGSLLPKQAQNVIQKTHTSSRPALKMLKKEGFETSDQIDVFDAGPVVASRTAEIRSVKTNTLATVYETTIAPIDSALYIISNTSLDFRACYGRLELSKEKQAIIPEEVAETLQIKPGNQIRYIRTHSK